jgi:DNA-binding transcriptional MocR family regulator
MTIWAPKLTGDGPLYRRVTAALERDVERGALAAGARLPTQRALAARLGVAVATVTRAYADAELRGLIVSEVGRGTFVRRASAAAGDAEVADLRGNSLLPTPLLDELRRSLVRAVERGPAGETFDYGPHGGTPRHRAAGVALAAAAGVPATREQLIVTAGAQHGLTVTFATLLAPGDTLLVEELTYTGMLSLARLLGLRLRPLAMDAQGLLPDALDAACEDGAPRALYLQPVLQNPTSAVMSERRRDAIAEIARERDLTVVEDDTYGFLLPEAPRLAAVLPRAIWLTGASKVLLPALRVGFLRAPAELAARLEAAVGATVYLASPLLVEAVAAAIDDGTLERVAAWKRAEVAARQELAAPRLAGLHVSTHPASPHLWIDLPNGWMARDAVAAAARQGILVTPAEAFAVAADAPRAVRLSLGPPISRPALAAALERLAAMLAQPPAPAHVVA